MLLKGLRTLSQFSHPSSTPKYLTNILISKLPFSNQNRRSNSATVLQPDQMASSGITLNNVVKKLNDFASTSLAESWDNVGLLIEPVSPRAISHILLTNDLTEAVMQEAVDLSTDMIISYHPPIFSALKSISSRTWKERVVATCLENRIALYSPHTSWDAVQGGVNDWLASAFDTISVKPLIQSYAAGKYCVDITFPETVEGRNALVITQSQLGDIVSNSGDGKSFATNEVKLSSGETVLQCICSKSQLPQLTEIFYNTTLGSDSSRFKVVKCESSPVEHHGMGRLCHLKKATSVDDVIDRIKTHLNMSHLRLALAVGKNTSSEVSTIALCAGSGASVLKSAKADLFLTGEMLHHDILDAVHNNSHVILTNHSDSERGFLVSFAKTLANQLDGKVLVTVSKRDSDPLKTV